MKVFISIATLLLSISLNAFSQNFILEVKMEENLTRMKYDWNTTLMNLHKESELDLNFSIGISGKVYKWLYIKTTLGTAHLYSHEKFIKYHVLLNEINEDLFHGTFNASQLYAELLPEVRLLDGWLYFNLGPGIFKLYKYETTSGKIISTQLSNNQVFKLKPHNYSGQYYSYFTANIGTHIHYKNYGLVLEYGVKLSSFTGRKKQKPGIGFNQHCFKIGLSYSWGKSLKTH